MNAGTPMNAYLRINTPAPIDEAVKVDKYQYIMSCTNAQGIIEFTNDYFLKISGYTQEELIGHSHSIIRHPDMPRIIFKIIWDRLKRGEMVDAVVKNMTKNGRYYWVTAHFDVKKHPLTDKIIEYRAYRQAARPKTVKTLSHLYTELRTIEKNASIQAAEKYLIRYLDARNQSYDQFIDDVTGNSGSIKHFFQSMKKAFD